MMKKQTTDHHDILEKSGFSGNKGKMSYKKVLKQTQEELSPSSRAFSKFIHNDFIENISNIIGSTIARPNAILLGSLFSFLTTLVFYLVAKGFGYTLSGFESIGAFILGWIIGNIFDYFRLIITGKKY